jgi:hypothetical protein
VGDLAQQVTAMGRGGTQQVHSAVRLSVVEGTVREACGVAALWHAANGPSQGVPGETVNLTVTAGVRPVFHSGAGAAPQPRQVLPLPQAPAETAAKVASMASRTKRATLSTEVKRSTKREALALLARPNQGERFTSRRAWSALRLSA